MNRGLLDTDFTSAKKHLKSAEDRRLLIDSTNLENCSPTEQIGENGLVQKLVQKVRHGDEICELERILLLVHLHIVQDAGIEKSVIGI